MDRVLLTIAQSTLIVGLELIATPFTQNLNSVGTKLDLEPMMSGSSGAPETAGSDLGSRIVKSDARPAPAGVFHAMGDFETEQEECANQNWRDEKSTVRRV